MNPSKLKRSTYHPTRVTVAILVHIPHLTGYFTGRWQVLNACLESLRLNTTMEYDLLVFDNSSCPEIGDYLAQRQADGWIEFLLRSRVNLGKQAALRLIFRVAPGELVAYADDDFYFEPGWLTEQVALFDAFPNAGMISGYVIPSFFDPARISATLAFAEREEVSIIQGRFTSDKHLQEWAVSTGRTPEQAVQEIGQSVEVVLEYQGRQAFAAANHDQFLAPKQAILEALPPEWSGRLMGGMIEMDQAVNQLGYLRLATRQRTTRHLGNRLDPSLAERFRFDPTPGVRVGGGTAKPGGLWRRFLLWSPIRTLLLGLYSRLFRWINPE